MELLVVIAVIPHCWLGSSLLPAAGQGLARPARGCPSASTRCGSGASSRKLYLSDNSQNYPWDGPSLFSGTVDPLNDGVSTVGNGTSSSYQNAFNQDVWWPNAYGPYMVTGSYRQMFFTEGRLTPCPFPQHNPHPGSAPRSG